MVLASFAYFNPIKQKPYANIAVHIRHHSTAKLGKLDSAGMQGLETVRAIW